MNGATALDCENTIRSPNSTNTSTIGTSQYFFSWRRNCRNSANTRPLLMGTPPSVHPFVMPAVAVAWWIRLPSGPGGAAPGQRIRAGDLPDERQRDEHDPEQDGQQHACVDVPQPARKTPPRGARVSQDRRGGKAAHQQQDTDPADDLPATDATAPQQHRGDRAQDGAN